MSNLIVIDASAFLTALFGNKTRVSQRLSTLLRDDAQNINILTFTIIEFANGVRFSTRNTEEADRIIGQVYALQLPVLAILPADMTAITRLSYRLSTTIYDTAYHYMALIRDGTFITCDKSYFKKAASLEHITHWD